MVLGLHLICSVKGPCHAAKMCTNPFDIELRTIIRVILAFNNVAAGPDCGGALSGTRDL
jgi:hypothetical protein